MKCISIHLTDLCNSKCTFCVVGSPHYAKDTVEYEGVLDFIRKNAGEYKIVNIHGGEATTHQRFLDVLSEIRARGYTEVHLQTNGLKLCDEKFTRLLTDLNVRLFIVSLHGASAAEQDNLTRTRGGFQKTIDGIRNAKRLGAQVRTNTVLTRSNIMSVDRIVSLCAELSVDHVNISNLHPTESGFFSFDLNVPGMDDVGRAAYKALSVGKMHGIKVTLEGFPHCTVAKRLDALFINYYRNIKMLMRGTVIDNYDRFMDQHCRVHGPPCTTCAERSRCGGVYKEYVEMRGWSEFIAIGANESAESHSAPATLRQNGEYTPNLSI